MTDASTHGHSHVHDHLVGKHAPGLAQAAGASLLEVSAIARLFGISILLAALWVGIYWALH